MRRGEKGAKKKDSNPRISIIFFSPREYYRERPRGEFLTRGAALSSNAAAAAAAGQPPPPDFGAATVGLAAVVPPPQVGRGGAGAAAAGVDAAAIYSLSHQQQQQQQHDQLDREPRRYVASSELIRGGRAANLQPGQPKEGRGGRSVPTILRKSEHNIIHFFKFFTFTFVSFFQRWTFAST